MAMIPLSPVIEWLLKSLGYEYLQTNGHHHHHHQHSHAPPIRPPSNLPIIEQHIDKPEIPRSNKCNFLNLTKLNMSELFSDTLSYFLLLQNLARFSQKGNFR